MNDGVFCNGRSYQRCILLITFLPVTVQNQNSCAKELSHISSSTTAYSLRPCILKSLMPMISDHTSMTRASSSIRFWHNQSQIHSLSSNYWDCSLETWVKCMSWTHILNPHPVFRHICQQHSRTRNPQEDIVNICSQWTITRRRKSICILISWRNAWRQETVRRE